MEIGVTKMSSKGQIVIPKEMRNDIKEGDRFVIIKRNNQIILQKANERIIEDIEFARRTEKAWQEIDKGNFRSMSKEEFLRELKKW